MNHTIQLDPFPVTHDEDFFFFKPRKDKIMIFSEYFVTGVWSDLKELESQFWMWVDHRAFSHIIVYYNIVSMGVLLKLWMKKKYNDGMIVWIFRLHWWTNSPLLGKFVHSCTHSITTHECLVYAHYCARQWTRGRARQHSPTLTDGQVSKRLHEARGGESELGQIPS